MSLRTTISLSILCCSGLAAQTPTPSVLEIAASYHFGEIGTVIANSSNPGPDSIFASCGTLTLRPDLTLSSSTMFTEVLSNGQVFNFAESDNGTYAVAPNAVIDLDLDITNPGTDLLEVFTDPTATYLVTTRSEAENESFVALGLRVSSGQSNSALNGVYHLVDTFWELDTSGLSTGSVRGTVTFDGSGGWTATASEQNVSPVGVASNRAVSASGSYTVASDGGLLLGGGAGAISPNADVFFLVDHSSNEVILTLGVRIGTSYDLRDLAGDWGFGVHEIELSASTLGSPRVFTQFGLVDIDATSTTAGSFAGQGDFVENDPSGLTSGVDNFAGSVNLLANGTGQLIDPIEGVIAELLFADTGTFFISAAQRGFNDVLLGLRTCAGAEEFGAQTAGTGGIAPALGIREFPILGSTGFALRVVGGRGGANALLPISLGPGTGFPLLGGTIWFDPGAVLATASLPLSGAFGAAGAGEGTLPLFVPTTSTLLGVPIYSQAFVLDPNAPAGVAMSGGLRFEFCR